MNDSFTFKATLKTTSSQQIFVKTIQTLSSINKEINVLITPQCLILSSRNSQFSSALKVEFGRQFFDDWYYKPFYLEYGLEGRSDFWKASESDGVQNKPKKNKQRIGDCYSFNISALGVLLKNFDFQRGYSKLINQKNIDKENSDENGHGSENRDDVLEDGEEDIILNNLYNATGEAIEFRTDQEKESVSSIELLLDNTLLCSQTRINKLKITTRNSSDNKLIKTYMPNIIPCSFENYVIEKRYKCRFGNQYLTQLTKNNDSGFIDIFRDLISLYGLENLDVDLKNLKLDPKILNSLKKTDHDQKQASLLMPNKEVFEDFENDGIDYALDDSKLYVNFIKSSLSIWKDITENMSNSSIDDIHMKIDSKRLVIKSLTTTLDNANDNLKLQAVDTKNNTKKNDVGDKVASNLLRDGLGISNSILSRQLTNTCLALGIDHELTFKLKDFKNFLHLIFLTSTTQKLQNLHLLNFLKQEEYKEGKKGLTDRLNILPSESINFWFADNPGAPIMMEFNSPTIWKAETTTNSKIDGIINQVKFKLFLLTDYRIAQEKLVEQAAKISGGMLNESEANKKESIHPLLQLSIKKRDQRRKQTEYEEKSEQNSKKHLFIDLEETEGALSRGQNVGQDETYDYNPDENENFLRESQLDYPEIHQNDKFEDLEFFEENDENEPNNKMDEFVDENGNNYNYNLVELLNKLENDRKKEISGDSLLKDFNKFQSRKRALRELEASDKEVLVTTRHPLTAPDFRPNVSSNANFNNAINNNASFNSGADNNANYINNSNSSANNNTTSRTALLNASNAALDERNENHDKTDANRQLVHGIFEEDADMQQLAVNRKTTMSFDSEPVMKYGKKHHQGPLNYTEDEDSIGPTQERQKQSIVTKGLLD